MFLFTFLIFPCFCNYFEGVMHGHHVDQQVLLSAGFNASFIFLGIFCCCWELQCCRNVVGVCFFKSAVILIFQFLYFVTNTFLMNNFVHHWVLGFYKKENLRVFLPKFVSCHLVFRLGNFLIGSNSYNSNHASAEYLGTGSECGKVFAYSCLIKVFALKILCCCWLVCSLW